MEQPPRPRCSFKRASQSEEDAARAKGLRFATMVPYTDCLACDGNRRDCRFFIDADEVHRQLHPSDDDRKV